MSAQSGQSVLSASPLPLQPTHELVRTKPISASAIALRLGFWSFGILLASVQAWIFRYEVAADSISYLDMSDALMPGSNWHRLVNGMYSALYPLLLGIFRRLFNISPGNEIPAAHLLGVVIFIFAFACFEFFLVGALKQLEAPGGTFAEIRRSIPLPRWAYLAVAYSVFLWASIGHIQLVVPRADMLMSGFVYLAVGVLVRMHRRPAAWKSYLALGAILGVGIIAKEAMLMMGVFILAITLFMVENWRPALKMAAGALGVMLLIGSLYFVPLSLQEGHLTLGEAGRYVYIVTVDGASPHWYLQTQGSANGSFLHKPEKIFSDPPAYAFGIPALVTEPLRFDSTYWTAGLRPHFVLQRELAAVKFNLRTMKKLFVELSVVIGTILLLGFLCGSRKQVTAALLRAWPVWLIGLVGSLLYVAIFVEPRYVAAFMALFCLGILAGFPVPMRAGRQIALVIAVASFVTLLYPVSHRLYNSYSPRSNESLNAAQALEGLGLRSGDRVARISPSNADITVERVLRAEIVAEVDHDHAADFWKAPFATQQALLSKFASQGVKAVIAISPTLTSENRAEWSQLGSTAYWVWRPPAH